MWEFFRFPLLLVSPFDCHYYINFLSPRNVETSTAADEGKSLSYGNNAELTYRFYGLLGYKVIFVWRCKGEEISRVFKIPNEFLQNDEIFLIEIFPLPAILITHSTLDFHSISARIQQQIPFFIDLRLFQFIFYCDDRIHFSFHYWFLTSRDCFQFLNEKLLMNVKVAKIILELN